MHRINNYTITKESTEDMIKAGGFNPRLEITFKDKSGQHTHKLSVGADDILDVYREGMETYVLSTNPRLDYVGLEIFEGPEEQGSVFFQGDQVKEVLGRGDLVPFNAIKRLIEHIM